MITLATMIHNFRNEYDNNSNITKTYQIKINRKKEKNRLKLKQKRKILNL